MKIGLVLTGLQRNCEPFIKNQLNLLIKNNKCDLFIFTSNTNNDRYANEDYSFISYKENKPFTNKESFFKEKYKEFLKDIYIDEDDKLFKDYYKKNVKKDIKFFHYNLLQAYFKVYQGLKLLFNYEKQHSFKYDVVVRARLDGFLLQPLNLSAFSFSNNECYLSEIDDTRKEDSIVITNRNSIEHLYSFIEKVIEKSYQQENIDIEGLLYDHLNNKGLKTVLVKDLYSRIGATYIEYKKIPYFKKQDLKKLTSLEVKISYEHIPKDKFDNAKRDFIREETVIRELAHKNCSVERLLRYYWSNFGKKLLSKKVFAKQLTFIDEIININPNYKKERLLEILNKATHDNLYKHWLNFDKTKLNKEILAKELQLIDELAQTNPIYTKEKLLELFCWAMIRKGSLKEKLKFFRNCGIPKKTIFKIAFKRILKNND